MLGPYRLEITRDPLVPAEEGIDGFSVDSDAFATADPNKFDVLSLIERIIQAPSAIFNGLQRDHFKDALAYSGKCHANFVLVAFAHCDRRLNEIVIFDWQPRAEDRLRPGFPANWGNDFEDPIYGQQ